jgi:hypothetical protein
MADYTFKTFKNFQEKQLVNENLSDDSSFQTKEIPSGKNTKFWIYPDGKIVNLGKLWHYQHILANVDKLKAYGISPEELTFSDEQSVRLYALSKGFARLNYTINGGRLIAEIPSNNWGRKMKAAVYDFIFDNIRQIDYLIIRVLDSQGRPMKSGEFNWINSTRDQKMQEVEHILEKVQNVEELI